MKSVAVVGAGPGGLIAARKLLQSEEFSVTIFEKTDYIGGVWSPTNIVNPNMRTNQSKFLMSFSDFSWESLRCGDRQIRIYPKASEVYQYLKAYFDAYIPSNTVHFRTEVERVEYVHIQEGEITRRLWRLYLREWVKEEESKTYDMLYDHLVIAPGFYQIPKPLQCNIDEGVLQHAKVAVLHSTEYRQLSDLNLSRHAHIGGKKRVLIAGGSHSGSDIASLLALQFSDARYSPLKSTEPDIDWSSYEIIHVTSHEMIALPSVVRDSGASNCTFQPIDLVLFNRSSRPAAPPPSFSVGLVTREKVKATRKMIETISNGYEGFLEAQSNDDMIPKGVLSDTYAQFLQAGVISQFRGTLTRLKSNTGNLGLAATITKHGSKEPQTVGDIYAVIYATGFDVPSSFSFLSAEMKRMLSFDESCAQAPLILDIGYLSQNSSCTNFAMVGFPGTLWGLFEMQARAIVQAWTASAKHTETPDQREQREKLLDYYNDLRKAVKERKTSKILQNPFGDGVGILEQASRELRLDRFDLGFSETQGFVCSSRYLDPGANNLEALKTMSAVQKACRQGRELGRFLARAVFHGLLGSWIAAGQNECGSITVIQHNFHPRYPTNSSFDWEYLAVESMNGQKQSSLYRYDEQNDSITVWSTAEDDSSPRELIGTFDFNHRDCEHGRDTVIAAFIPAEANKIDSLKGDKYRFLFTGATLKTFTRMYGVGNTFYFVHTSKT